MRDDPPAPEPGAELPTDAAAHDPRAERPLRLEQIGERRWGIFRVRYPLGAEAPAERAAEMLRWRGMCASICSSARAPRGSTLRSE